MNNALMVMWHRQIKAYFRNKQRLVVMLVQPLLFLIAFGFGIGAMFEQAGNGNYIQYLIPGIVGMTILMSSTMNGMSLIWDKQFGFLKETLVAPVSRLKIMIGRTLGGATVSFIQGLLVLVIAMLLGFTIKNWYLFPLALLFMILIALAFTALGTAIGSWLDDMQGFQLIMNLLIMPIFFLSGALFPLDQMTSVIQWITKINPLTYGVAGLRASLTGITSISLSASFFGILFFAIVFIVIGSWRFKKIQI